MFDPSFIALITPVFLVSLASVMPDCHPQLERAIEALLFFAVGPVDRREDAEYCVNVFLRSLFATPRSPRGVADH
jgi:hypothetical protein